MVIIKFSKDKKFHVVTRSGSNTLNQVETLDSREAAHENIVANLKVFNGTHVKVEDRTHKKYKVRFTMMADGTMTDVKKTLKPVVTGKAKPPKFGPL